MLTLCLPLLASIVPPVSHVYFPLPVARVASTSSARMSETDTDGSGLVKGLFRQLVGNSVEEDDAALQRDLETESPSGDDEYVPLVLVVGAAGRTGRIIVRKLVMQGFRVCVLVRSLSTDTLNLLGSGVTYSYGDMTDYRALLDAMEDVDRVIFAADCAGDEGTELEGLSQVLRSFQDTRTFMYGEAEATKLTLLKMRRDIDFNRWKVEDGDDDIANRLASAGIGPQPAIAYWKRSPTKAHNNGVFVGKVFDTYLGAAAVSCSLSGLLLGSPRALSTDPMDKPLENTARPTLLGGSDAPTSSASTSDADAEAAAASVAATTAELDRAAAAMAADEVPLDLGEYSGLNVRALGDGKKYTVVLRTPEYKKKGLEYHADFPTKTTVFETVRLPFSNFVPVRGGRPIKNAPELDRRSLTGMALAFYPQRNDPDTTTGEFYISLSNVKAYRKRDEPEFVYISDAGVGPLRSSTKRAAVDAMAAAHVADEAEGSVPAAAKAAKEAELAAAAAMAAEAEAVALSDADSGALVKSEDAAEHAASLPSDPVRHAGWGRTVPSWSAC